MNVIQEIEKEQMKKKMPEFRVGDTVRVFSKIKEGDKERLQAFEGIVLKIQGASSRRTFTVRKLVQGIGVERIFPIFSPKVDSVKIIKTGKVRRARLNYLKDRKGSSATRIAKGRELTEEIIATAPPPPPEKKEEPAGEEPKKEPVKKEAPKSEEKAEAKPDAGTEKK